MCVIYRWDPRCRASTSWIHQMGVNLLQHQHLQPFYGVLVNDGSIRYAAQGTTFHTYHQAAYTRQHNAIAFHRFFVNVIFVTESLMLPDTPVEITHHEVGRYFKHFMGTHYLMNSVTSLRYPDDLKQTVAAAASKYGE